MLGVYCHLVWLRNRPQAEDHDPRFFPFGSKITAAKSLLNTKNFWLVLWNMTLIFPIFVGMMIQSDVHSMIFQRGRLKPPTMKNVDECCESTTSAPLP